MDRCLILCVTPHTRLTSTKRFTNLQFWWDCDTASGFHISYDFGVWGTPRDPYECIQNWWHWPPKGGLWTFSAILALCAPSWRLMFLQFLFFEFFKVIFYFLISNFCRKKWWFWRLCNLWRRLWTIHFGQCPTGFHEPKCGSFSLWEQRRTHKQMWSLCQWICWKLENL